MRLLETLTDFVKPAARHQQGIAAVVWHLGGFGLFLLAIVDSSPIPTFGGLDILTAILAARQREPWYYYAAVATAGVLDYPLRTFIVIVALGRAVCYGAIAAIASHYGRRFVVGLGHLGRSSKRLQRAFY